MDWAGCVDGAPGADPAPGVAGWALSCKIPLAMICAACCWLANCWSAAGGNVVPALFATVPLMVASVDLVVSDTWLKDGSSATCPVTVAPASAAAVFTPSITELGAPGSVIRTILSLSSRWPLPSSSFSESWRKDWAALSCAS